MNLNEWTIEDKIMNFNNYVEEYTKINHPKMVAKSFKTVIQDLSDIISVFEVRSIKLTKKLLNDFENIVVNNNTDDMTVEEIINDKFYCPTYYAHSDTFIIPEIIYNFIQEKDVTTNVAVYNIDKATVQHNLFKDFKSTTKAELIVDNLPKQSLYTVFDNVSKEVVIIPDLEYMSPLVFKNLPLDMLMNTKTLAYDCAYCINDNKFYFNYRPKEEFDEYVKTVSEKGFEAPIMLKLTNNCVLAPNNLKYELIAAMYLGIPEIPVCIIQSFNDTDEYEYINTFDNKAKLVKFLQPQIILE